jgi:hypothetical protein
MTYTLILMACLASVPNSTTTCRTMEATGGTAAYCAEQRRLAVESLHREGYRVFSVCAPVADQAAQVKK